MDFLPLRKSFFFSCPTFFSFVKPFFFVCLATSSFGFKSLSFHGLCVFFILGWRSFLAGGLGGAAEILATMPLDVAKTTMQLNPKKYTSPLHTIRSIHQSGGVRALYYGMPAFLSQTSLNAAIRFYTVSPFLTSLSYSFPIFFVLLPFFFFFHSFFFFSFFCSVRNNQNNAYQNTEA